MLHDTTDKPAISQPLGSLEGYKGAVTFTRPVLYRAIMIHPLYTHALLGLHSAEQYHTTSVAVHAR